MTVPSRREQTWATRVRDGKHAKEKADSSGFGPRNDNVTTRDDSVGHRDDSGRQVGHKTGCRPEGRRYI